MGNGNDPAGSDLLAYLDIATKFRNHALNIQLIRNVIFTGSQTVMLACYATTIDKFPPASAAIAIFGIILSIVWFFYYRASLYWLRYWEYRCKQVNDSVVGKLKLDNVNIFRGHPIGLEKVDPDPPIIFFDGKFFERYSIHDIIYGMPVIFCILWLILVVVACIACPYIKDILCIDKLWCSRADLHSSVGVWY